MSDNNKLQPGQVPLQQGADTVSFSPAGIKGRKRVATLGLIGSAAGDEPKKDIGLRMLDIPHWYHKIELPGEIITPGWSPIDAAKYGVPDDLTGKRVLDIGAWDGYWTWEALKRGAKEVVAIDDFSDNCGHTDMPKRNWSGFDLCREAFGFTKKVSVSADKKEIDGVEVEATFEYWQNESNQNVNRTEMSVYDIELLGRFDIVFFFGTIYHLKHPMLALELVSKICDGEIYIESAVLDDYSPYRGGMGKGYPGNDMVAEFYPDDQFASNAGNWWVPTIQCLAAMVDSAGFKNISGWGLTDKPAELSQCRGFVYGSKTGAKNANVEKLTGLGVDRPKALKVAAVMSVPRLGFQDNSFCVIEGLVPLKIPIIKTSGAYWGQCLERGIQQRIDEGFDAVLTLDYDTIFTKEDVETLMRLMAEHPEADAIVAMQAGRGDMGALMTLKTKSGQVRSVISSEEFTMDVKKIATGHFGLTLLRTESLMRLPQPWFWAQPDANNQWGPGKVDDDIYFWKQMEKHGMTVYTANRVVLGHLQLMVKWLGKDLESVFQTTSDFRDNGKPKNIWI